MSEQKNYEIIDSSEENPQCMVCKGANNILVRNNNAFIEVLSDIFGVPLSKSNEHLRIRCANRPGCLYLCELCYSSYDGKA